MQITLLSHIEYTFVFYCSLFEITSLNSLKIIKKSPSTEYSDSGIEYLKLSMRILKGLM